MKSKLHLLVASLLLATTGSAWATMRYVNLNNANPTPPYTSWAAAATNIQDAVDAAAAGDLVVVTNGTYAGGWVVDPNANFDCVVVDTPLTLQSVNGPGVTVIEGGGVAGCVYLPNHAELLGFTLTNGWANFGGGVYCQSTSAVVTHCVLSGNSANEGGGAYGGTLNDCTLTSNSALYGGGAFNCTLNNCTVNDNYAYFEPNGGGPEYRDEDGLPHPLLGGRGGSGGGAESCTLNNCTMTGNGATRSGGAACDSTLNNCLLTGNSALFGGGAFSDGIQSCTLNNCSLIGNSASWGGGAYSCSLNNCIVYFNTDLYDGGNYDPFSILNYCCTTPLPTNGIGNLTNAPLFMDYAGGNLRLQSNSPCINSGNNAYVFGSTDLDGNPRIVGGTVDIGAYEYQTPLSLISYAWLQQYSLPINMNTDTADLDGTGFNVYQD